MPSRLRSLCPSPSSVLAKPLPIFAAFLLICFLSPQLRGQSDAPRTRAARLTYMQGSVLLDVANSTLAQLNMPLLAGAHLTTGADGQAEVEFEDGSLVRLTPNSALSLDALTIDPAPPADSGPPQIFNTHVTLLGGLAYLELRATPTYQYAVAAGGDILTPVENATVRINLDQPPAIFSVLDGAAHIVRYSSPQTIGFQTDLRAGESLSGDPNDPNRYFLTPQIAADSWDQWNLDRDQQAAAEAATRTTARDGFAGGQGYGWSDLDAYGSWYDVPGDGPVWQPAMAATDSSFDPYADGAWVYYPATGYVWASAYNWGWTPYRCGNWIYFDGFGWGWTPVASCGAYGWPAGGVFVVNILQPPPGYHHPRPPTGGPGHPIVPIHPPRPAPHPLTEASLQPRSQFAPRTINGYEVQPLKPASGATAPARGSEVIGASLHRDFPVDPASRAPAIGTPATQPPAQLTPSGWRSPARENPPSYTQAAPSYNRAAPSYNQTRPGEPAASYRTAPPRTAPPRTEPTPANSSAPRYTPPPSPPPASHPAPAPAPASHPAPTPAPAPKP